MRRALIITALAGLVLVNTAGCNDRQPAPADQRCPVGAVTVDQDAAPGFYCVTPDTSPRPQQ
jgi:hypothetical protein